MLGRFQGGRLRDASHRKFRCDIGTDENRTNESRSRRQINDRPVIAILHGCSCDLHALEDAVHVYIEDLTEIFVGDILESGVVRADDASVVYQSGNVSKGRCRFRDDSFPVVLISNIMFNKECCIAEFGGQFLALFFVVSRLH